MKEHNVESNKHQMGHIVEQGIKKNGNNFKSYNHNGVGEVKVKGHM